MDPLPDGFLLAIAAIVAAVVLFTMWHHMNQTSVPEKTSRVVAKFSAGPPPPPEPAIKLQEKAVVVRYHDMQHLLADHYWLGRQCLVFKFHSHQATYTFETDEDAMLFYMYVSQRMAA